MPVDIEINTVVRAINTLNIKELSDVVVFDIYDGKTIKSKKKSISLGLIFQSKSRTLTDEQIDEFMTNINQNIQSTFEITIRNSIQNRFALELQKYILNTFQNFGWKTKNKNIRIQSMWAIINKKNDFNVLHSHANCFLSAAYYVKAEKNCGRFQVENPNIAKKNFYPEKYGAQKVLTMGKKKNVVNFKKE